MSTPNNTKDVIYIDIDDEITAIIDKVRSSEHKIIALVLPKRAAVMQSIVNMKLLKRTAEEAKKHIVLITNEASLLPLAGTVGLHVAKTPQSRPEIPATAAAAGISSGIDDEDDAEVALEPELDARKPVGEYAARAASPIAAPADDDDTIELDNADEPAPSAATPAAAAPKPKKDKKLMVPDFNKFRLALGLGIVAVVLLGVGLFMGLVVMPKATVAIKTDSSAIRTSTDVTFKTNAREVDTDAAIIPAVSQEIQKTQTQQVEATGSLNKGEKAGGEITITNCSSSAVSLPAGTGFSTDGLTFISAKAVNVPKSSYDFTGGGFKCMNNGKAKVNVVAQKAGTNYNITARDYSIANSPENVKATGSAMSGGTDVVVKIVQQSDIDNAKQKITSQDTSSIKQELKQALSAKDLYALTDTLTAGPDPETTTSVPAGTEADVVTVTQKTTYTMLGAKEDDIKKLIAAEVNRKIDEDKQTILDYGLDQAVFKIQNQQDESSLVTMQVTSVAGSDLNLDEIKKQVAGKKANDAKQIIGNYPGVTAVDVTYSPFWVSSIPKKTSKITVTVEKPDIQNAQ